MSVTLQQLQFYRAVARNLSFSDAAKELYTSQPYVSNQIRKLESHYGVPLFVRSQPRIALTEAGSALYQRIDQLLGEVEQLEQVVAEFRGLRRGTVQLGATQSVGNHVLPDLIAAFNRDHPEIVIQARISNTDEVLRWLELDEVEIGICPSRPDSPNLVAEPFYRERLVVVHPAGMQLPDPLTPAEFAELPKVVREEGSLTLSKMRELLSPYQPDLEFVAQLAGTTAVNEAVAAGLGVSLVPERSARAWVEAGSVGVCAVAGVQPGHEFHLIYSQQRYITPAARALIEHFRQHATARPR